MKFWNTLSPLVRNIIIIAAIVLLFLIIYWWRKNRKTVAAAEATKNFNEDYKQLTQQSGQSPSYPVTNYTQLADKIYESGCPYIGCFGTDEQAIYDVFDKMNNDLDVLLLIKAFGARQPRGGICIPIPGTGECDYPLAQWLQGELSSDDFKKINESLAKKGIKFQF